MDANAYIHRARDVIRTHGVYLQAVAAAEPADPPYCYTVGLQRLRVPRPEVIVFGLDSGCAGRLLQEVYEQVRLRGPLPRGQVVTGLFAGARRHPVRVEEVRPEWVEAYAGMVRLLLRRRATQVPMLQLVLADDAGRWPEDPAVDPALAGAQPLLSHEVPWRAPYRRNPAEDLFSGEQPETMLVATPVHGPVLSEGRYELLCAEPLEPEVVRISEVPLLADDIAVGDVVQTRAGHDVPGLPHGAAVMGAVLEPGGRQTMAFRLPPPSVGPDSVVDLTDVVWDLHETGHTTMATTTTTLRVNTLEPDLVEAALRPFVRDGLLRPVGLRTAADPFLPPIDACPDCQAARRAHS